MLYKLRQADGVSASMTPLPFGDMQREKHLEDLLAKHLPGLLFEDNELMPISQERARQEEADIYALNEKGDLIVFELKRGSAGEDAIYQALRYCETAAHWDFQALQKKLRVYLRQPEIGLLDAHRKHFGLQYALNESDFNRLQHLIVVGSAGSDALVRNVNYWRSRGLSVNFIPYRVYDIGGEQYFEFFSPPYDRHANPAEAKGVIFDTNRSFDENSIWYMCENNRVAAFGSVKGIIKSLRKRDRVFLYHAGEGIVAAGEVKGEAKEDPAMDALYCDLNWLTGKPSKGSPYTSVPAWQIKQITQRNFYWATTMKTPYLSIVESQTLLDALKATLG